MAVFNEISLPLAKEQVVIVITGVYDYEIDTSVYDPAEPKTFAVAGADATGNKLVREFREGIDFTFTNNILTFTIDDIFQMQYFVFKITQDTIARETQLDGGTLAIFREEVKEEIDSILGHLNLFKEDIFKKRVLVLENSFMEPISLPLPATGQSWYWNGVDIALFDVASAEETKAILDDYVEQVLFVRLDDYRIETVQPAIDQYVEDTTKPSIDFYVTNTSLPSIDSYVENTTKPDIDNYTNQKKNELQVLVDNAILDNGPLPPASDIHQAYYGYWWIDDITTMVNRPPDDLLKGDISGQLSVKESDGQNAGSGSNPPAPRTKATYIFRGTGGVTLYQIQTDETVFTDWMPLGDSANIIPYTNTDTVTFPTGIARQVYWNGTAWILAHDTTHCVGIAVRVTANLVNVYLNGTIILDASDVDADGNPFEDQEYYFLTNNVVRAGKFEINKPTTGIFQSVCRVYTLPASSIKYMKVEIDGAEDITPLVYTDQGDTQVVLRPTFDEYNKYKEYNSLSEIGLTAPVTTTQIIEAMEDGSRLITATDNGGGLVSDAPVTGILTITRISAFRVEVTLNGAGNDESNSGRYIGTYYNNTFSGYSQVTDYGDYDIVNIDISNGGIRSVDLTSYLTGYHRIQLGFRVQVTSAYFYSPQLPIDGLDGIVVPWINQSGGIGGDEWLNGQPTRSFKVWSNIFKVDTTGHALYSSLKIIRWKKK